MWRMYSMAVSQSSTLGAKAPLWLGVKHVKFPPGMGGLGGGMRGAKRVLAGLGVPRVRD